MNMTWCACDHQGSWENEKEINLKITFQNHHPFFHYDITFVFWKKHIFLEKDVYMIFFKQ